MSMKPIKTWMIRAVLVLGLFFVAAIVIQFTVLPKLIERALILGLRESGFTVVSVKMHRVTYWRAVLQDLVIGKEGAIHVNEIEMHYSPGSMIRRRVHTIILSGVSAKLHVIDGTIEGIPQANVSGAGGSNLPFDRLEVRTSILNLNWEGREIQISLEGAMQNTPGAATTIQMKTSLGEGAVTLNASIDFNKREGEGDIQADGVGIEFFEKIFAPSLPTKKLKSTGSLDVKGHFALKDEQWVSKLMLGSEQLSIQTEIDSHNLELSFKALRAGAEFASSGAITINLTASLNKTPITVDAIMSIDTREGECEINMDGLDASILNEIIAPFLPPQKFNSTGSLDVKGRVAYKNGRGVAGLMLSSAGFSIQTELNNRDLKVSPTGLKSEIEFKYNSGNVTMHRGLLEVSRLSIINKSQRVTNKDISCTLSYSWAGQGARHGSFTIGKIHFGDQTLPTLSGMIELKKEQLKLTASGHILPDAKLNAAGWLDWSVGEPFGELSLHIPRFNIKNENVLAEQFPVLKGHEIRGAFAADMHLKLEEGILTTSIRLDLDEAMWKNSSSEAGLEGITGSLTLNSFAPLATEGNQRLTVRNAYIGSFKASNGVIEFRIGEGDSIFLNLVECNWAGGKVSGHDILVEPFKSRLKFDLHAEGLLLQEILDFLEYNGVKGDGLIYGHLPIDLEWGQRVRFSFGDGFFEARPQRGRLQFSKENAMTILGITDEVDPKKANNQETVRLMMLKALQDMEYTELKIIFKNEDKGWMAHLQTQGYGPRGEKENQIPIGGLNININNLDELLNSMMLPRLGVSQIKFGNN